MNGYRRLIHIFLCAGMLGVSACGLGANDGRSTDTKWRGVTYLVRLAGSDERIQMCFGPQVGPPGSIYVAGCPGLEATGVVLDASLGIIEQAQGMFAAVEITGSLSADREVFRVDSAVPIRGPIEPTRSVPADALGRCEQRITTDAGVHSSGAEQMPLGIIAYSLAESAATAVAIDEDWYRMACEAGLSFASLQDYLAPA